MKTTRKHFALFERECLRLKKLWRLDTWDLRCEHVTLREDLMAAISVCPTSRVVWVKLALAFPPDAVPIEREIVTAARHEMIHLLLNPLGSLAQLRCVTEDSLVMAEHEVLHRLMRLLFGEAGR